MQDASCTSIIRASAIYDLLLLTPFAIPGISLQIMQLISLTHQYFDLNGTVPLFTPFHLLFVNIMAAISVIWAILRINTPTVRFGLYDLTMRFCISVLMLIYILADDISALIWLFIIAELGWAIVQAYQCAKNHWGQY